MKKRNIYIYIYGDDDEEVDRFFEWLKELNVV
jgi:hypothetical protein